MTYASYTRNIQRRRADTVTFADLESPCGQIAPRRRLRVRAKRLAPPGGRTDGRKEGR